MAESETLYEQIIKKLKNKWAVVLILLIFSVVIAISQLIGGLSEIGNFLFPKKMQVQIDVYLQPYDLMAEKVESPRMLEAIKDDIDNIQHITEIIAGKVADAIQPERFLETTLEILGNSLQTSHPMLAYIHFSRPGVQFGPLQKEFGGPNGLDLLPLFQDISFFRSECNCIEMSIRDRTGYFEREFLRIFESRGSFSFEPRKKVEHMVIKFKPRKSKIIIETFKGSGANSEIVESTKASLESALRKKLETYEFLDISGLALEDLQRKREEIKNLLLGPGKTQLIDQYNVDFILTGSLLITTTRRFLHP